jgi:hypothetical protein
VDGSVAVAGPWHNAANPLNANDMVTEEGKLDGFAPQPRAVIHAVERGRRDPLTGDSRGSLFNDVETALSPLEDVISDLANGLASAF